MASPLPPDPYAALGVTKDADLSAIRSAHRKLALKHHPDRIKDEALREKGKDEFQKIQQAYEILSDPERRTRYDDRVRLAELRKEAMMRDIPQRTNSFPMRSAPQPTHTPPAREYTNGQYYTEERRPSYAYESRDPYEEPARSSSRKYPEYEKRAPPPSKSTEKDKKPPSSWGATAAAATIGAKLKKEADKARSKVKEKEMSREKKERRSEKVQARRPAYAEVESDNDSDPQVRIPRPTVPRAKTTSDYTRKPPHRVEIVSEDEESYVSLDAKWEQHHGGAKDYMSKAGTRPVLDRKGSDAYAYWKSEWDGRRSGSDNERRPESRGKRAHTENASYHPPPFSKAPSPTGHMKPPADDRGARPSHGSTRDRERERERDREIHRDRERDHDRERDRERELRERERDRTRDRDRDRERERERERDRLDRDHRKMMPGESKRPQTAPTSKSSSKRDPQPAKSSTLKHSDSQLHDSGYSSNPQTPEMRDESPSTRTVPKPKESTKYKVSLEHDEEDSSRRPKIKRVVPSYREQLVASPEPAGHNERDRRRERPERPNLDTRGSAKTSLGAALVGDMVQGQSSFRRSDSGRFDGNESPRSPRDTPPISRQGSGRDRFPHEADDYRRPAPDKVNVGPRRDKQSAQYVAYNMYDRDFSPSSRAELDHESQWARRNSTGVH